MCWRDVSPPETNFRAAGVKHWFPANSLADFLDANMPGSSIGPVPSQPKTVWRTHDGGQTWIPSSPIPPLPFDPGIPTR